MVKYNLIKLSLLLFAVFLIRPVLRAQLCNGNLGDPIINVTFGTHTSTLLTTSTSFDYSGGCPGKGKYSVSNFLLGCGDRTWFLLAGDHTGNENGAYMVVNAESTPGIVYTDTVRGLCGNTTYQFAAWITNVMQKITCGGNPILPNLTFKIETLSGVVLANYNTGDIAVTDDKIWKQYGLNFTTTAGGGDVRITLETTPVYGCGSAFAVDDITFAMCGPALNATLDLKTGTVDVCAGYTDPFILSCSFAPGLIDPVMQWQSSYDSGESWQNIAGATSAEYAIPQRDSLAVLYRVLLAERANIGSSKCRITSNIISTNVHPKPMHQLPRNIRACTGKDLVLPARSDIAISALWTGPNGYTSDNPLSIIPNVQLLDTGLYKLTQQYNSGCSTLDSFYVGVYPGVQILIANPEVTICEGKSVVLSAAGGDFYQWTPAEGLSSSSIANPTATPSVLTFYNVTASNAFGCRDSASIKVTVLQNVTVDAGPDQNINLGDTIKLNATVKGTSVNFFWSPSTFINDIHSPTPTVYPAQDVVYTLTAISNVGCGSGVSSAKVKVYKDIFIPDAFSPNDDGKNDRFRIIAANNYKQFKLLIYNKWGRIVYSGNNISEAWDGRYKGELQATGAYIYVVEIHGPANKKIVRKGTVMLLR